MVWTAQITSVEQHLDKTNERIVIDVQFDETDTRQYLKKYTLWIDELTGITLQDFKDLIQLDIDKLTKLDNIKTTLDAKIGEIL